MKKLLIFFALTTAILASSCTDKGGRILPNVSGASYEVLWVISDSVYKTPAGEAMFNLLTSPISHLPQEEEQFDVSHIDTRFFDHLLRTTRNIIFVTVDPTKYTTGKIRFERSRWADSQAIATVTAPDSKSLQDAIERNGDAIIDFFVKAERERMMDYYKGNINHEALKLVNSKFGCNIALPSSLNKYNHGENFMWISNGSGTINQNIVIYTTPYYSKGQLTHEAIMARRDSVMQANIPGSVEGSYMGTEYRFEPPVTKFINRKNSWCAETHGLWKMCNGQSMGGPYVSHTLIDEMNMQIITIEGFVFAPGKSKRNPLRQVEAMVYSTLLPFEINEITVSAKN